MVRYQTYRLRRNSGQIEEGATRALKAMAARREQGDKLGKIAVGRAIRNKYIIIKRFPFRGEPLIVGRRPTMDSAVATVRRLIERDIKEFKGKSLAAPVYAIYGPPEGEVLRDYSVGFEIEALEHQNEG